MNGYSNMNIERSHDHSRTLVALVSAASLLCGSAACLALTSQNATLFRMLPWKVLAGPEGHEWSVGLQGVLVNKPHDHVAAWDATSCPEASLCGAMGESSLAVSVAVIAGVVASTVAVCWESRRLFDGDSAEAKRNTLMTNLVAVSALGYALRRFTMACDTSAVESIGFDGDYGLGFYVTLAALATRVFVTAVHYMIDAPTHNAFAVADYQKFYTPAAGRVGARAPVVAAGYIPDGLSEEEYKKQIAKDKSKREKNFSNWMNKKKKGFEDLTEWQKKRDAKFESQGRGLGHMMVKSKYKGPKDEEKARGWFGERILTREYKESKAKKGGKK